MNTKNINYNSLRKVHLLSALFFITILFSCKKDGEIIPIFDEGNLDVLFTDTFSITTSVVPEDSLRTDLAVYHLLGLYNDPIYGPKSSSIYTQMTLAGTNVDFGAIPVLDSVILTMTYQGFYGDTTAPMSINVFELTTEMSSSNDYYSNTRISHDIAPLATKVFTPNLTDSVDVAFDNTTVAAHLRINLGATFGAKIIAGDINGTGALVDDATFQQYINGLYITTTDSVTNTSIPSGSGGIGYFDMNTTLSTVTVYYNDTSSYAFSINSGSAKYSRFDHNYVGTDIEKQLNNDITRDVNLAYVSTMAGVKTKLFIPSIKDILNDGNVIINKAELIIPIEAGSEGTLDDPVATLAVVGIDVNNAPVILPDINEGLEYYGGTYNSIENNYTFNISRSIHDLVYNTDTDYGMYLLPSGSSITAKRIVLGTWLNPVSNIKLNITYSKVK
jgi:hypothetical protein